MNDLQQLELQILQTIDGLTLRYTLAKVVRLGNMLIQAKRLLPHGQWQPFVSRIGLKARTARVYM
jgi:hypothetical protein